MNKRVILHCDCNSFFASVETVFHPEYAKVPMAVCGSTENRHGIVLAKNELAKSFGIKTAETVCSAKKKCPALVIAPPHHELYYEYSKKVNAIYAKYTDMIEPFGIDESWLDVTASQRIFGTGVEIAEKIRKEVKEKVGITISVGVSFNKVFAKLGSDYKKPDAVTVISENNFKDIVYPLPVGDMLFIGKKTEMALAAMGIKTIGELAASSRDMLRMRLGKMGDLISAYARGEDDSPVLQKEADAKSVGNGFTFKHDLVTKEECRVGIEFLSEEIGRRLREKEMKCTTVQLTIKDEYLRSIQRQRPQSPPTDIGREIATLAYEILLSEWSEGKPIRMLTVTACNLVRSEMAFEQIDVFSSQDGDARIKSKKREETLDKIRQKFGKASIKMGSVIDTDIGIKDSEKT